MFAVRHSTSSAPPRLVPLSREVHLLCLGVVSGILLVDCAVDRAGLASATSGISALRAHYDLVLAGMVLPFSAIAAGAVLVCLALAALRFFQQRSRATLFLLANALALGGLLLAKDIPLGRLTRPDTTEAVRLAAAGLVYYAHLAMANCTLCMLAVVLLGADGSTVAQDMRRGLLD